MAWLSLCIGFPCCEDCELNLFQLCQQDDNTTHSEVAALGRPFTLGMLYDGRKDEVIPGFTLWDDTTPQDSSSLHTCDSCVYPDKTETFTSDSIESKFSLLDVDAPLKVSFLSGLIQVGGSAEYLNDTKKFKNQSRVTFQYKSTTHFKQLTQLPAIDAQQMDFIKKKSATHMVTGILYGANAFFVFDSEKLEDSSVQKTQEPMEAVIKKIPTFQGEVNIKLTDEEKALTDKFSCKFYGDFILESNPATFEDAVKTYIQLPKLLGENGEKAVPLKVWLMPLRDLFPEAPKLTSGISPGLVKKAQNALEDLHDLEKVCNDLLEDKVVKDFPKIQEKLSSFQTRCVGLRSALKEIMAKKLPLIRAGKEDQSKLEKVFKHRDKTAFSQEKLTKWLDHQKREINVVRSCVDVMEGIKIVRSRSELDREVLAAGVEEALCFVFTSMESADLYLQKLADYDQLTEGATPQLTVTSLSDSLFTSKDQYYSDAVLKKMREKARFFHDLTKVLKSSSRFCFLVAVIANRKYPGATIYHYRDGSLVTDDFSKPDVGDVKMITDRRDLIWYACDLTLDPNTANKKLTLSEGNKKATKGAPQEYPDHLNRFDKHPQALCKEGLSGRHYWEVEWSNSYYESVYVAAAYPEIDRKEHSPQSRFGCDASSWCFGQFVSPQYPERVLCAYRKGKVSERPFPFGCERVGVFLDWPAGTLSYYSVSSDTLSHLYTFNTRFTEPVYPGFWVGLESNYVYLCPVE